MRIRFLGTGTSFGIPVVGCRCDVCRSGDPRNRRTRHAMLLEEGGRRLLVDTPPELRLQLVEAGVEHLDGVYLTHVHADHTHGLDDLRIFTLRSERSLPVHVPGEYVGDLRRRFAYIWDAARPPSPGTSLPDLRLVPYADRERISVAGFRLLPIGCPHGSFRSYGFRLGDVALLVDAKAVPEDAWPLLEGVEVLVVNALWWGDPHPTHFNVEEALEVAERLSPARTYLTHLTHRLDHERLSGDLPEGVVPAYDGLEIEL